MGDRRLLVLLLAALLPASGCRRREAAQTPAIGEAYAAPETLNLRKEISPGSPAVATLKRSEHVEIVQRRRRFVKVRTAANQEGWTEQGQLLTPEVFRQIEQMAKDSARLPSSGVYRARDKLNLHFEPYRWAPSFYQLKDEEKVDVLAKRITERLPAPPAESQPAAAPTAEPQKSRPRDEWYLVRTINPAARVANYQRAGWVLARMVDADIPDEVAQYAEGRRITSYFALSEVTDGGQVKKTWLWTTIERGNETSDFDGFRIFNWSRRRHHYETAYHERGLNGFFPITVATEVDTKYGSGPGFSMIVEKADGKRYLRRYVMLGHIVRRYADEPAAAAATATPSAEPAPAAKPPEPGFLERLWRKIRRR